MVDSVLTALVVTGLILFTLVKKAKCPLAGEERMPDPWACLVAPGEQTPLSRFNNQESPIFSFTSDLDYFA